MVQNRLNSVVENLPVLKYFLFAVSDGFKPMYLWVLLTVQYKRLHMFLLTSKNVWNAYRLKCRFGDFVCSPRVHVLIAVAPSRVLSFNIFPRLRLIFLMMFSVHNLFRDFETMISRECTILFGRWRSANWHFCVYFCINLCTSGG